MMKARGLRRGFTTGTCAAAGAKAAAHALLGGARPHEVEVTLPSGASLRIPVESVEAMPGRARATIIKDAGDDPDVTNGAEFVTEVALLGENRSRPSVRVRGGEGVGTVTRQGLKIRPGRPAINPVPLSMIRRAVFEAAALHESRGAFLVTVTVPKGAELAKKTMNPRLGIVGGISILGTTGIVEPMSLAAYTHSISCAVDVALANGLTEAAFSTGRSSEKVVERELGLPAMACILTGDHMGYALGDAAGRKGLKGVVVAGQFGKFTKLASGNFETHCSDSEVDLAFLSSLARKAGAGAPAAQRIAKANTAREAYMILRSEGLKGVIDEVCRLVHENSSKRLGRGKRVRAVLVGYSDEVASVYP